MTKKLDETQSAVSLSKKREHPELSLKWADDGSLRMNAQGKFNQVFVSEPSGAFKAELLGQIAKLGSQDKSIDEGASNFALGFVDSMKPRDPAETLLLTQMAAIHQATMMLARRFNHIKNIPQQDAAERALNKLARSFAAQMDTLKRYRSKGQQTVRVERVTVQEGGQAIVGNVQSGGRGRDEK